MPDKILTFDPVQFPKLNEPDSGAVLADGIWKFEGEVIANSWALALNKLRFAMDLFALKCGYYSLEMNAQNMVGNAIPQKSIRKGFLCKTLLEVRDLVTVWGWQIDPPVSAAEEAIYKEFWKALYGEFKYEAVTCDVDFKARLARKKKMADDWGVAAQ